MKRSLSLFSCTVALLLSHSAAATPPSPANQKALAEAFTLFQKGAYAQAVSKAESIQATDSETKGTVAFFLASSLSKMQQFDQALPHYEAAVRVKHKAPSLYYDYGQALFAMQKLKDAETQFRKSIVTQFKMGASAYYIGYLRQLRDDKAGAKDMYARIQKLSQDADKVKQPALYQIAELELDRVNEIKDKRARLRALEKDVLPLLQRARDYSPGTPTNEQSTQKITEIQGELDANVPRMRNGIPIPRQAYTLLLSQDFTYDSNVVTQADSALIQVSNKNSLLSKTGVLAKYQFNWRSTWSFFPELNTTITMHSRRSTPGVYQNDNITIAPALRTKYEHISGGKAASALIDLEYSLMLRDYLQAHQFPYYSRSWNVVLGERVSWLASGSTTFKANIKLIENYNPDRNAYAPGLSLQQNFKIFGRWDLSTTLSADYLHARDDVNDEKNYKLRISPILTHLIEKIDVTPAVALSFKDTMKQRGSRGTETTFNPSLLLNRELTKHLDGSVEYNFTKNYSKSKESYQYTKHEARVGVGYHF